MLIFRRKVPRIIINACFLLSSVHGSCFAQFGVRHGRRGVYAMQQLIDWIGIERILDVARRVLLYGPTSTGKTYLVERYAKSKNGYAVTLHEASSADELRGSYIPNGDSFDWTDGICVRAWREGVPLVLNEINRASDEVKSFLYVICDNAESARLTLPTGETISPRDGFKVFATMNGEPDELTEALRARFPSTINVVEPNPNAIQSLPEDIRRIAKVSCMMNTERRIVLRQWIEYAMLREALKDENLAGMAVFGDRYADVIAAIKLGYIA